MRPITLAFLGFLFLTFSTNRQDLHAQSHGINFMVLGDWGREGKDSQTVVAKELTARADLVHPKFILSTGDNFYEDGVKSITDSQWQTSYEKIYSAPSLHIPWYVSLGNHDYITNADVEVAYTAVSDRWKMPARYYAVEVPVDGKTTALFLIIDTSPFVTAYQKNDAKYHVLSQSTARQLVWMDSVLSHSKAKWKFAVGHHPLYCSGSKDSNTTELIQQVLPIFKKYHLQSYFCGHAHNMQHLIDDGINFYISGSGSRSHENMPPRADAPFLAAQTGFLEVNLTAKKLTAKFYNQAGKMLNSSSVTP